MLNTVSGFEVLSRAVRAFEDDAFAPVNQAVHRLAGVAPDGIDLPLLGQLGRLRIAPPPPPPPAPEPPQADFARRLNTSSGDDMRYVYGPVLPGAADDTRIHPVDQGESNACGTSSLAMIMDYLGVPVSRETIDSAVRRTNFGATPGPLLEYARDHGLEAEGYNNGTWEEMKGFVERGIPVQAVYNTKASGDAADGHIVMVVGFRTNKDTGEEEILFRNSARGGDIDVMSRSEFEHLWGNHFGYHNFFMAYGPKGTDLPPSRWDGVEALNNLATGLSNISNNFDRIIDPDNFGDEVHGLLGILPAAVQVIGTGVGFLVQTGGNWLRDEAGQVPVLGAFTRPLGSIIGGIGAGLGDLFGGLSNAGEETAGAFGALFRGDIGGFFDGIFDAGSSVVGAVTNTVSDVGKGVVNAVEDTVDTVVGGVKAVGSAIGDFFGF